MRETLKGNETPPTPTPEPTPEPPKKKIVFDVYRQVYILQK